MSTEDLSFVLVLLLALFMFSKYSGNNNCCEVSQNLSSVLMKPLKLSLGLGGELWSVFNVVCVDGELYRRENNSPVITVFPSHYFHVLHEKRGMEKLNVTFKIVSLHKSFSACGF